MAQHRKRLAWRIAIALSAALALGVLVFFLAIHSLDQAFAKADFAPLVVRTKAAVAPIAVMRQSSSQTSGREFSAARPTTLQSDARLFDAWLSALQIAEATLKATNTGSWILSTEDAAYLAAAQRRDPWNHYVCVLRRGGVVAVISGGPNAPSSPVCSDIKVTEGELEKLPRARLLETPAGNLILLATKLSSTQAPGS